MRTIMSLWLPMLGLAVTCAAAGPGNCVGRCGEVFSRGQQCTCDFSCLQHNECCPDFERTCTIAQSCVGRCGETFRRGQLCECDPQCIRYNTCCHDYQLHCDASVSVPHPRTFQPLRATAASGNRKSQRSRIRSNSESEEWFAGRCPQYPGGQCPGSSVGVLSSLTASTSGPVPPALLATQLQHASVPPSKDRAQDSSLHSYSAPPLGSRSPVSPSGPGAAGGTAPVFTSAGGAAPFVSNQGLSGLSGLAGSRPRPSTLQDVAQALGLSVVDGGSEGPGAVFADVDLCSDSPINGLTALNNGTILIFKGELFWAVDPISRAVGRPQSITNTLGVPSPVDTIFTRCNCHGNTYIIKGDRYWRFDGNMVMEPGFPKPVATEFPGLTGAVNAALAVPAARSSPETVYFFKRGDIVQRFTFSPGSTPSCSFSPRGPLNTHSAHQTDVVLSGEINIKVSLKGVPTPVTSALSMQSLQTPDRYHHYVFSGPLFFSVQVVEDWPVVVKPDPSSALVPLPILSPASVATSSANMVTQDANPPRPSNSIRVWLRCP
ncbi:hypothetical protein Q5P01_010624 [Channa striata]|uniref:SMB domain-containing protein n=1 Tax=Channa striata TaxID=64152 RepID=A0AA88MVH1_CHASR|nr:hypothetical protein Q5P01_010624 [Channa striata]